MKTKQLEHCLYCQGSKAIYARGICASCYQKWRRAMKMIPLHRQADAEQKLISLGKLLPAGSGPRADTNPFVRDLAEFLTESERAAEAEARGIEQPQEKKARKKQAGSGQSRTKPTHD